METIEIEVKCPYCGGEHKIVVNPSKMGLRKKHDYSISDEERERRSQRAIENLDSGRMGRPKGSKDLKPRKERSDKGVKRGPMSRGSEL